MSRRPLPVSSSAPTIAIAPGWGESPRCFRRLAKALNTKGFRVQLLKSSRYRLPRVPMDPIHRQAANVNLQLEEAGTGKVIGVGHSMAGVYLLLAASGNVEKFEAVVLVAPAGLLRSDSFFGLIGRLNKKVVLSIKEAIKDRTLIRPTLVSMREGVIYFLLNPLRGFREAAALAGYQTLWRIKKLRERGVKVFVIAASDDVIYPPSRIERAKNAVDGWVELGGQHDLWFYPHQLAAAIHTLVASPKDATPPVK